jgi:hypothetical protein
MVWPPTQPQRRWSLKPLKYSSRGFKNPILQALKILRMQEQTEGRHLLDFTRSNLWPSRMHGGDEVYNIGRQSGSTCDNLAWFA